LEGLDSVASRTPVHLGAGPGRQGLSPLGKRSSSASTHPAAHTGSLAPRTAGRRTASVWARTASTALVEERHRQTVKMGSDGHNHVPASERLLRGRAAGLWPSSSEAGLSRSTVGRPGGGSGGVDRFLQGYGRVAQRGQFRLPAEHQVPQGRVGFAIPGGPGRHRPTA
jgi:hypothetical protein